MLQATGYGSITRGGIIAYARKEILTVPNYLTTARFAAACAIGHRLNWAL